MKPTTRNLALACLLALASAAQTFANGGSLLWEKETLTFETEIGQERVDAVFRFTNVGDETVTIERTHSPCGCTVPTLDKKVYGPGESGEVKAVFTLGARTGRQDKGIDVVTRAGGREQTYKLLISADIPVPVTLAPRVRFWKVGSEAAPQDVRVTLHESMPLAITELARRDPTKTSPFAYEIETVRPGLEYVVKFTPESGEQAASDVFFLSSEDDTKGILKTYPIYLYVR